MVFTLGRYTTRFLGGVCFFPFNGRVARQLQAPAVGNGCSQRRVIASIDFRVVIVGLW